MNYRTKIPIATYYKIIPAGSDVIKSDCVPGQYSINTGYNDVFMMDKIIVETHPEIYEPVPTKEWTDKDMLDFAELSRCKLIEDIPEVLKYFRLKRKP